jgi:hypothetical protein
MFPVDDANRVAEERCRCERKLVTLRRFLFLPARPAAL